MAWWCSARWSRSRRPKADAAVGAASPRRYRAGMRALGLVLFLFGLATLAIYFLEVQVEWLAWIGNWGENAAWGIRIGTTLLGLVLLMAGKKKGGGKK